MYLESPPGNISRPTRQGICGTSGITDTPLDFEPFCRKLWKRSSLKGVATHCYCITEGVVWSASPSGRTQARRIPESSAERRGPRGSHQGEPWGDRGAQQRAIIDLKHGCWVSRPCQRAKEDRLKGSGGKQGDRDKSQPPHLLPTPRRQYWSERT